MTARARTWGRGVRKYSLVNLDMMELMLILMPTEPRAAVSRFKDRLQCSHETSGVDKSDADRKDGGNDGNDGSVRGPQMPHYPPLPQHVLWFLASRASPDGPNFPRRLGHLTMSRLD